MKHILIFSTALFLIIICSCKGRYDNGYVQELHCNFFSSEEWKKYDSSRAGNNRDYFIRLMTSDTVIKSVSQFLLNIDSCYTPEFIRQSIVVVPDTNHNNQTDISLYVFITDSKKAYFICREFETETWAIDLDYLKSTFEPQIEKNSQRIQDSLEIIYNKEKEKIENLIARHQQPDSTEYIRIGKLMGSNWRLYENKRQEELNKIPHRFERVSSPQFGYYPRNGIAD